MSRRKISDDGFSQGTGSPEFEEADSEEVKTLKLSLAQHHTASLASLSNKRGEQVTKAIWQHDAT